MDKSLRNIIISFAIAGLIFIVFIVMVKINIIPLGINIITKTQKDVVQKELNLLEKSFEAIIFTERNRIQDMTATEDIVSSFSSKEVSGRTVRYLFEYMNRNKYCLGVSFISSDRNVFFTIPEYSPLKNTKFDIDTYNIIQQDKLLVGRPIPKQIIIAYPVQEKSNLLGYSLFHYSGAYILKEIAKKTYDAIQAFSIESMTLIPKLNMVVYNIPNGITTEKSSDGKSLHNIFEELYTAKTDTFLGPIKFGKNEYYFFNSFDNERITRHILVLDKKTVSVSPWQFGIIAFCALSMIALFIYIMLTLFMGGDHFVVQEKVSYSSESSGFKPASKIQEEVEEEEFLAAVSDEEKKKDFFFEQVKNEAHFDHELKTLVEDINEPKTDMPLEVTMDENLGIEIPAYDEKIGEEQKHDIGEIKDTKDSKDTVLTDTIGEIGEESLIQAEEDTILDKDILGSESIDDLEKELRNSYPNIETIAEQSSDSMDFTLEEEKIPESQLSDLEFAQDKDTDSVIQQDMNAAEQKIDEKIKAEELSDLSLSESSLDENEMELPSIEELKEEEIDELHSVDKLNEDDLKLPEISEMTEEEIPESSEGELEDIEIPSIDELKKESSTDQERKSDGKSDFEIMKDQIEDIELPSFDEIKSEADTQVNLEDLKSDENDLDSFTLPELENIESESSSDLLSDVLGENKEEFSDSMQENKITQESSTDDFFKDLESNEIALSESELEKVALDVEETMVKQKVSAEKPKEASSAETDEAVTEYEEQTYGELAAKEASKNAVDYIAVYKLSENKFVNDGSNKKEFNAIHFAMDDPIVVKLEELKKDIFIPIDINKFKPLIQKNSELFNNINALYIKGIYDEGQLVGMIQLYSSIGNEKSKEEYFQIASKIQEML